METTISAITSDPTEIHMAFFRVGLGVVNPQYVSKPNAARAANSTRIEPRCVCAPTRMYKRRTNQAIAATTPMVIFSHFGPLGFACSAGRAAPQLGQSFAESGNG